MSEKRKARVWREGKKGRLSSLAENNDDYWPASGKFAERASNETVLVSREVP